MHHQEPDLTPDEYRIMLFMAKNQLELLNEDLERLHIFFDEKSIPRTDREGNEYSIRGRINLLIDSIKENHLKEG